MLVDREVFPLRLNRQRRVRGGGLNYIPLGLCLAVEGAARARSPWLPELESAAGHGDERSRQDAEAPSGNRSDAASTSPL